MTHVCVLCFVGLSNTPAQLRDTQVTAIQQSLAVDSVGNTGLAQMQLSGNDSSRRRGRREVHAGRTIAAGRVWEGDG